MQGVALGGFLYGLLKKNWTSMPKLPGVGTSGTVAIAVYVLKPKNKMLQDLGIAAAAIAGYSFGETGTVSGDSDDVLQA